MIFSELSSGESSAITHGSRAGTSGPGVAHWTRSNAAPSGALVSAASLTAYIPRALRLPKEPNFAPVAIETVRARNVATSK